MWTFICVALFSIHISTCKPSYRDYIPNGYIVPNPCVYPSIWDAVGHFLPLHHTIVKNQFGWVSLRLQYGCFRSKNYRVNCLSISNSCYQSDLWRIYGFLLVLLVLFFFVLFYFFTFFVNNVICFIEILIQ